MKFSHKKKFFKSLQIRILLVILIFLFVPVALLLNYNFNQMESVLNEKTSGLVQRNLEQIGNEIDNVTEDIMKIASMVSSNSVILANLSGYDYNDISDFESKSLLYLGAEDVIKISEVQKQIYYVKNNFFNYDSHIILFGADGNIYSALETVYDEWEFKLNYIKEYKNQNWYHILKGGEKTGVWTAPFTYEIAGPEGEKRYISLARTMKDYNTQDILGTIMVNFSEDNFKKFLGSDFNGIVTLLNEDKQTIFSSNSGEAENQSFSEQVYSKIPDRGKGYFSTEIEDKKYLLNYYSIEKIGWSLVAAMPYKEVMEEITSLKTKTFTINIFIFGSFFIIALGLILYMLNPLKKLIWKIRKMKIGDHSIELKNMEYYDDVSGIVNSFEYMMKRVEELIATVIIEQKYESDLKYEALRAQINPHFLFNTLNTIKWSAMMSGSENVSKMISALGKLLEVSMNKGEDEITLREELELTECYLYIQNIRFNDKFTLNFEAVEQVRNLKILKLILQPIVENSIIHGLKSKTSGGEIRISATIKENKLLVLVQDNGVGISKDKINHILDPEQDPKLLKYSNIGLINIHERLKIKYGDEYGLIIESEEGKGTTVSILLPVIKSNSIGGKTVDKSSDS